MMVTWGTGRSACATEVEIQEERLEAASNAVKLQRPAKGHRVQSLRSRIWPPFLWVYVSSNSTLNSIARRAQCTELCKFL
jgi:hypothetical protein